MLLCECTYNATGIADCYAKSVVMCIFAVSFDNYMQHDAHEFLNYLLNTIADLLQGNRSSVSYFIMLHSYIESTTENLSHSYIAL